MCPSLPSVAEVKNHMLNNKAGMIGLVLGICLIAVSLFAYSQVSALQTNVNTTQASNDNLHAQITDLQQQVTDLQSQLDAKTSDLSNAQSQITSLNTQIASLNAEIADLHVTVTMHEQTLSQMEYENYNRALAYGSPAMEHLPI
jgi:peptidoglycan hydrolase CwlO-like protein